MIEFLNRLFGRHTSGAMAKERLRLVLMSDHLSLAPEMIDAMKRDLVDVIARYVEVDREKVDVHFEHQDTALAMLANIPITGVNRNANGSNDNGTNGSSNGGNGHAELAEAPVNAVEAPAAPSHPEVSKDPEPKGAPSKTATNAAQNGHRPRRKRRKNGGSSGAPAPAT